MEQPNKNLSLLAVISLSALGLVCLACVGLGVLVKISPQLYEAWLSNSSVQVGQLAPDFELGSLDSEQVRLSQFRGQPVLLVFGATWCPDCVQQAPLLQQLHESHPDLVILDVDIKEPWGKVQGYAEENGLDYTILFDLNGDVNAAYQVQAIPTDLFIDKDGVVRAKLIEAVTPELLAQNLPLIGVRP